MLFKRAEVTSAYLKMGLMGFAGTGKTYTGTQTAIGLIQYLKKCGVKGADKPLFFLDTETGSDWIKPAVEEAGIELFTAKTRAFSDLVSAAKEAERDASILLVDSISHFWAEWCETYRRRKGEEKRVQNYRLQFQDWAYLKGPHGWAKFTDWYINSPLHVILCGRAGYEYDYFENEDGKKELEKTGIKMKAENEMGYEPSLLVLMERFTDPSTKKTHRTATILKDRSTTIDGKEIVNPTFASFLPHIECLNLGGKQMGVDMTRDSSHTIPADAPRDNNAVQRKIVLDEIQTLLVEYYPGQTADHKASKIKLLKEHFDGAVWTRLEEVVPLFELRAGYNSLHEELTGKPSRYLKPAPSSDELNDEIPHSSNVLKAG